MFAAGVSRTRVHQCRSVGQLDKHLLLQVNCLSPLRPRRLANALLPTCASTSASMLQTLQQEELLALEKLGTLGSWAPKSLTKGLMGEQHEQMMREQQQAAAAVAEASQWRGPGGGGGGGRQLDAEASSASASGGPPLSYRDMAAAMRASIPSLAFGGGGGGAAAAVAAVTGGGLGAESSTSSLAAGGGGGGGGPLAGGPSMRQLLTSMSMKRIAGGGPGGPQGPGAAALSFRWVEGRGGRASAPARVRTRVCPQDSSCSGRGVGLC